jgi:hypothetical protein
MGRLLETARRALRVLLLAALCGCGKSGSPAGASAASGSGGGAGLPTGGGGSAGLAPCLDQPGSLPAAPSGRLPCELIPPGLQAAGGS